MRSVVRMMLGSGIQDFLGLVPERNYNDMTKYILLLNPEP